MSEQHAETELPDFIPPPANDESLILALDGFEGPLDLLLTLARTQKVDIAKISVLKLADQYLAFIEQIGRDKLELAADYLVMAAWLTYLKSRLVLPQAEPEGVPGADEMAAQLRWRLARLHAMREASVSLMARNRLERDVFPRGAPEPVTVEVTRQYKDNLFDLLTAYSHQRVRKLGHRVYEMARAPVYLIEQARSRLERALGGIPDWSIITRFLPPDWSFGPRRRTAVASTFSAVLELARDGKIEIRQMSPFGAIFVKDRAGKSGEGEPT